MQAEQTTYKGVYRVRKISQGEHVIHVPQSVVGDYALYLGDKGTMSFFLIGVGEGRGNVKESELLRRAVDVLAEKKEEKI